ncbi:MAG: chloride channel protein [Promethearchaeota archaeon]
MDRRRELKHWILIYVLALIMGVIGGLAASLLKVLIDLISEFLLEVLLPFLGPRLGYFLFPVVGSIIVGIIIFKFAEETKGSGVPVVVESQALKAGELPIRVGLLKILVTSITIGSGGSAGREGPSVLIGAAFGSFFGTKLKLTPEDRRLLITCGIASGIAGSFHAPIGGALFAMEIVFQGITLIQGIPVFASAAVGAVIASQFFGFDPILLSDINLDSIHIAEYGFFLFAAFLLALLAFGWTRLYFYTQEGIDRISIPKWMKPVMGGLITGTVLFFMPDHGMYGTGISGINEGLQGQIIPLTMILLGTLKIITTTSTIGSGSSGGIFGPTLYIGAMFGGAYGYGIQYLFPNMTINPVLYCFIGIAAFNAAATQAPLNVSILIAEMVGFSILIPPMLLSSVGSYLIARVLMKGESIYTMRLQTQARGSVISMKSDSLFFLQNKRVNEIMATKLVTVSPDLPILEFAHVSAEQNGIQQFPVMNFGKLEGLVFLDSLYNIPYDQWDTITVKDIMEKSFISIPSTVSLQGAMDQMHSLKQRAILVTREEILDNEELEHILQGIITISDIVQAWKKQAN